MSLAFIAAAVGAAAVFYAGWHLLGVRELKPERRIDSSTLFDLVKLAFGAVAGTGALVALVVAYRRQRVDEDGALREATRLHTERFTTAVSQLGDPSEAVRLGGVHALAGLADDAPTRDLRQTGIDVLCAYLRMPYIAEGDLPPDDVEARHSFLALREVRHTIIRIIRDHLRLPADHPHSWQGHDFDFTGVTFDGGDFSQATFSAGTVSFQQARFPQAATGAGAPVSFIGAVFCGADVDFSGAKFEGGKVSFKHAKFSGGRVLFAATEFSAGYVEFSHAQVSGGELNFAVAIFTGCEVSFPGLVMTAGLISFVGAIFRRSAVRFQRALFSGGIVTVAGQFIGGGLDMSQAQSPAPGWLPASVPDGVRLPDAWNR